MKLNEFNFLDLNNRMEVVNQLDDYVDNYSELRERCLLYLVGLFFTEVIYDIDLNRIVEINSYKTNYLLDKYSDLKLP